MNKLERLEPIFLTIGAGILFYIFILANNFKVLSYSSYFDEKETFLISMCLCLIGFMASALVAITNKKILAKFLVLLLGLIYAFIFAMHLVKISNL